MLTKPDVSVLTANPAAEKMFCMSEEEIKKTGREGILVINQNTGNILKERIDNGKIQIDERLRRKNGSTFPSSVSSNFFTDFDGYNREDFTRN